MRIFFFNKEKPFLVPLHLSTFNFSLSPFFSLLHFPYKESTLLYGVRKFYSIKKNKRISLWLVHQKKKKILKPLQKQWKAPFFLKKVQRHCVLNDLWLGSHTDPTDQLSLFHGNFILINNSTLFYLNKLIYLKNIIYIFILNFSNYFFLHHMCKSVP